MDYSDIATPDHPYMLCDVHLCFFVICTRSHSYIRAPQDRHLSNLVTIVLITFELLRKKTSEMKMKKMKKTWKEVKNKCAVFIVNTVAGLRERWIITSHAYFQANVNVRLE